MDNFKILIPDCWIMSDIGEICSAPQYGWTTSAITKGKILLLRTSDITDGFIDWDSVPFCKYEPPDKEKYLLYDGDIVISRAGSVGYSHLIKNPRASIFASYLIRFKPLINNMFIAFFLKSPFYWNSIQEKKLGISIPNINASKLKKIKFPLPATNEQKEIVGRIEGLFEKLNAGVETLEKVKKQLKRYRQAVLKAAFSGVLTKEWRKKVLSDELRVLSEEQKELEKYKIDDPNLPELPQSWIWTRVKFLGEIVTGTTPLKKNRAYYNRNDFPFFKPADLNNGYNVIISKDFLSKKGIEKARLLPEKSILVTCIGATIGKTGLIRKKGASNQQINAIITKKGIFPEYIFFSIISPSFQRRIIKNASSTTLPILNKKKFQNLHFSFCTTSEQKRIIKEIEKRFQMADEVERVVDESLGKAKQLRQSILREAFNGNLTKKWREENPELISGENSAQALLEKIKKERVNKK